MKKNAYYKNLDFVRLFACLGVLLYHLNILKGGYLAVCVFFVLSGYLSCISLFKDKKVNLKKYYINRLKKIYLPLVVVVFISVGGISLLKDVVWLNLKPEVRSILLLYNNYWQIGANLDYFARFVSSPFMHFWYIAILLQFDLIFPFIFVILRKFGDKHKKSISIILLVISIIFTGYFSFLSYTSKNIMFVYYDTFSRIFSLLFGVSLGFIHKYFKSLRIKKIEKFNNYIVYGYLIILLVLFIFIKSNSNLFCISMIISTLISCRLIDYSTLESKSKKKLNVFENIIKELASISYEVYLVQYPLIYVFEYFKINNYIKIICVFILSFLIGYLLKLVFSISVKKKDRKIVKIYKYLFVSLFCLLTSFGIISFVVSKDYSKDMKKLEKELAENEKKMEIKQKAYMENVKKQKEDWENKLKELENDQSKLGEVVLSSSVVGVGDSVMLGAIDNLYAMFPNGYFDAKKSRTDYEANGILTNLKNNGMLGDIVVLSLGTNGSGPDYLKDEITNTCGDREMFWVNVVNDNDVHVNGRLEAYASNHSNVHIIDWVSYSSGHPEYFVADGIHLTGAGREAFTNCIYQGIYDEFLNAFNRRKEEIIDSYNNSLKNKYSFFGNDLLLNSSSLLQDKFVDSNYYINDYNYESLIKEIKNSKKSEQLYYNVVFMFDSKFIISDKELDNISKLLKDNNVYFIYVNSYKNDKYKIIDFSKEIKNNKDYLMVDKVHLTKNGNEALVKYIVDNINGR